MVSFSDALELGLNKLLYQNDASEAVIANIGSGLLAAVTPESFYVALHTGDPGESGNQTTNEASYPGYTARIAVARSAAGWACSTDQVSNVADILFGTHSGGASQTVGWWSTGTDLSGTGYVIDYGSFTDQARVCTAADTGDVFTCHSHGFTGADSVVLYTIVGATALPTGVTHGTRYYIYTASLTTDTFQLTTDSGGGGTPLALTSNGAGYVAKQTPLIVSTGVQPKIPAGSLIIRRS